MKIITIPIDDIQPNEWNPNEQDEKVFASLVENIRDVGLDQPILVRPVSTGGYQVVDGEHRYRACIELGFKEIPCVIAEDYDVDKAKFQTVRHNVIRGKMNPEKFIKLYEDMAKKHGDKATKDMMAFSDETAFKAAIKAAKKGMPKEMQAMVDIAEKDEEVTSVRDLIKVVNTIYDKYGDTLQQNFMIFTYGGKTHLWVNMTERSKDIVTQKILPELKESGMDINDFFANLMEYAEEAINYEGE